MPLTPTEMVPVLLMMPLRLRTPLVIWKLPALATLVQAWLPVWMTPVPEVVRVPPMMLPWLPSKRMRVESYSCRGDGAAGVGEGGGGPFDLAAVGGFDGAGVGEGAVDEETVVEGGVVGDAGVDGAVVGEGGADGADAFNGVVGIGDDAVEAVVILLVGHLDDAAAGEGGAEGGVADEDGGTAVGEGVEKDGAGVVNDAGESGTGVIGDLVGAGDGDVAEIGIGEIG